MQATNENILHLCPKSTFQIIICWSLLFAWQSDVRVQNKKLVTDLSSPHEAGGWIGCVRQQTHGTQGRYRSGQGAEEVDFKFEKFNMSKSFCACRAKLWNVDVLFFWEVRDPSYDISPPTSGSTSGSFPTRKGNRWCALWKFKSGRWPIFLTDSALILVVLQFLTTWQHVNEQRAVHDEEIHEQVKFEGETHAVLVALLVSPRRDPHPLLMMQTSTFWWAQRTCSFDQSCVCHWRGQTNLSLEAALNKLTRESFCFVLRDAKKYTSGLVSSVVCVCVGGRPSDSPPLHSKAFNNKKTPKFDTLWLCAPFSLPQTRCVGSLISRRACTCVSYPPWDCSAQVSCSFSSNLPVDQFGFDTVRTSWLDTEWSVVDCNLWQVSSQVRNNSQTKQKKKMEQKHFPLLSLYSKGITDGHSEMWSCVRRVKKFGLDCAVLCEHLLYMLLHWWIRGPPRHPTPRAHTIHILAWVASRMDNGSLFYCKNVVFLSF